MPEQCFNLKINEEVTWGSMKIKRIEIPEKGKDVFTTMFAVTENTKSDIVRFSASGLNVQVWGKVAFLVKTISDPYAEICVIPMEELLPSHESKIISVDHEHKAIAQQIISTYEIDQQLIYKVHLTVREMFLLETNQFEKIEIMLHGGNAASITCYPENKESAFTGQQLYLTYLLK